MYPTLVKSWEHSLVLKNYRLIVDMLCLPLLPEDQRSEGGEKRWGRQKTLYELRLDFSREELKKESAMAK